MSVSTAGIRFLQHKHPTTGRPITRITFRDWFVDVDQAGKVTVPTQIVTTQDSADFATCLSAAEHYAAQIRLGSPVRQRPELPYDPELPPAPKPSAATLVAILTAAKRKAAGEWTSRKCDIYNCTQTAWENTDINVPYSAVLGALRQALPSHKASSLSEVNDRSRGRADIVAFYDHAIALLQSPAAINGAA